MPRPSDDASLGFATTSLWNHNGRIFTPYRVTAGKAAWLERRTGPCPGDECPNAAGLYGTIKLRSAYAGAAIQVVRASDSATLDVGFVGNDLDVATLDAWSVGTTYTVAKVYDQTGNANHLTQATQANQPRMSSTQTLDNRGAIRTIQHAGPLFDSGVSPCTLNIPSTVSCDNKNMGVFFVGALPGCVQQTPVLEMNPASGTNYLQWTFGSSAWNWFLNTGGQTKASGLKVAANALVHGFNVNAGALTMWTGNKPASLSSVANSTTYNGGQIGAYSAGAAVTVANASDFEWCAFAIYARAVTTAEVQNLQASLTSRCRLVPQNTDVLVYRGDSIHFGLRATKLQTPIRRARDLLGFPAQYYNASRSGANVADLQGLFATEVAPLFNTGARNNVILLAAATNDIVNNSFTDANVMAATIFENIMKTAEQAKAVSSAVKVLGSTVIDRGAFTDLQRSCAVALNTLIRANAGRVKFDAIADYAADVDVGLDPAGGPDFFPNAAVNADGTHPNDTGYSIMATIAQAAVRQVWSF
jgi:lysophospholipase L1-like esterase